MVALSGLLTARVLGLDLPRTSDGATLFVAAGLTLGAYRTADGSPVWSSTLARVFTDPTVVLDPQTGQPTRGPGLGNQVRIAGLGQPALAVSPDSRTLYVVSATKPAAPVRIPAALRPYMGGQEFIGAKAAVKVEG